MLARTAHRRKACRREAVALGGVGAFESAIRRVRHHHNGPLTRALGYEQRPRVHRRFAIELPARQARVSERVDDSVAAHCNTGGVWITHDGD